MRELRTRPGPGSKGEGGNEMPKLCYRSVTMNEGLEFEKRVGEFRVCRCMHDVPRRNDVVCREMDGK